MSEKIIDSKFKFRDYQLPIADALENKGFKKIICIMARRSGKDILAFNLMIRAAVREVGIYLYCLPTYRHARSVIFDSITNDGTRFLDYIPKELIKSINGSDLRIVLINGSQISLVGSDSYDNSIVGSNAKMIVFSEWALCDERAYTLGAKPILAANGGKVLFLSTPRGQNHLFDLWKMAKKNPEWFCYMTTVEDTKHISVDLIQREIDSGEISEDLAKQEYFCDFYMGQQGSYYGKYIDKLRLKGQIGKVNHDPSFKVNTSFDIGVRDSTSIIFFQVVGTNIHIIDSYEKSKEGLEHYVQVINSKPYQYGKHIGPHDLRVREFTSGIARVDKARQLGINFTIADQLSIEDGIEAVRTALPKMYFDEKNCAGLIKALENYRQEWDSKKKVYKSRPLHDQYSHFCFTADTPILIRNGIRQIVDISEGDEVLTLNGWKECSKSWLVKRNAEIVEVKFQDGTIVRCTPDHLFLTESGWKSAESLTMGIEIQSSLTVKPLIIESVNWANYKEDVWCITVPVERHFSLSNGAVVHNCDAMRYLAISLPKMRDGLTKVDLDRMRANAYGNPQGYSNFGLPTQEEYDRNRSDIG